MSDEDRPVTPRELKAAVDELRNWIVECLVAQQKLLLTAFNNYADVSHARMQKVEAEQRIDSERLTRLEERLREIEMKIDLSGRKPQ